jgi:hypothetical protein
MDEDKGNVTFGETTELLVKIIGRDAILSILLEDGFESKRGAFIEKLKNIYKEDKVEFLYLSPQEKDNPQDYFKLFFKKLKDNYKVPDFVEILVNDTIWQLFHACLSHTPFEKNKTDTVRYLFGRQIFHLLYDFNDFTNQNSALPAKIRKDELVPFLSKKHNLPDTYRPIFEEAAGTMTNGNLSLLLRNIDDFALKQEVCLNLNLQTISRWDKGIKATWKSIKPILDFFWEKKRTPIVYQLLAVYLIKNAKKAFSDLHLLEKNEFDKIMIDVISMLTENRKPEEFYDTTFGKEDSIEYHSLIERCLILAGQPNDGILSTKKLIGELEEKCPKSKRFFSPWLKAKIAISKNGQDVDYNEMRKFYRTAFDEGKYYAGCFMWQFLLEAITLEKYQNELVGNLNDYYAFGYALEMFNGDKNTLLETLESIKDFSLFNQHELISEFCCILWQGPLLKIPYKPPETELAFKLFIELEMEHNDIYGTVSE